MTLPDRLKAALSATYTLERELGRGGMATVWLARDLRHKRPVALKVLHPELAASLGAERFQREIETAARLQHPHILGVHDSGEVPAAGSEPAWLWFTMPFVDGQTLRGRLARERQLPVEEAVRIAREVLAALGYAHAHGVVHRDIKPENVLLTEEGHVLVADFGIARSLQADGTNLTQTGMAVGTPAYMSPEQAMGDVLDARSDLYSLGCVLYELLVGEAPHAGPTPQAITARRLTEPVRPIRATREAVPAPLEQAVLKALARTPADRFATAAEFARALGGAVVTPTATPTTPLVVAHSRRRPVWIAAAAAIVAVTAAAFLLRRGGATPTIDLNRIAVAPFDVLAPDLQLWREGLVDLLARNLDGAGPLHAVPPTASIKQWRGRADPASARELGYRSGAALVVFGTLVRGSGDSVHLRAALLETPRGTVVEELRVGGRAEQIAALTDSLTFGLLRVIGRDRPLGAVRGSWLSARPVPAIKAFLQGEASFRRAEWDSAYGFYRRAVELDSGFALALNRMSSALAWQRTFSDQDANALSLRAGALNHGLAPRDSLLVVADSLAAALNTAPGHPGSWTIRRRIFETLEEAVRRYPDDPLAWYALADGYEHYGFGPGLHRSRARILELFERGIGLDSSFAPAYIHPVTYALALGDTARARRHARAYLALGSKDRNATQIALTERMIDPSTAASPETRRLMDTASADDIWAGAIELLVVPDSIEAAVQIGRAIVKKPLAVRGLVVDSGTRAFPLVAALVQRGHLREAVRHADPVPGLLGFPALAGVLEPNSASRVFARALENGNAWALGAAQHFWAWNRDTSSLRALVHWSDSVGGDTSTGGSRLSARIFSRSARAYLALVREDTTGALRELEAIPDTLCPNCGGERLFKARLLASRGRDREALALLDQSLHTYDQWWVPWHLERARVGERLGLRERAVEDYRVVTGLWRDPDPDLRPLRDEARAALARLTAEGSP